MADGSRWTARGALLISIIVFGAVIGAFDALGFPSNQIAPIALQTSSSPSKSASPSPSPSSCRFSPAPPPLCPTPSATSPKPSSSPSGSPSPGGGGETKKYESTITIEYTAAFRTEPDHFSGLVRTVTKCKPKRTVVLKRIQEGLDPVVGRDTTNRAGEWRVDEPAARGRYYAKVFKRVFTTNDVKNVCQPARSKTVSTNS